MTDPYKPLPPKLTPIRVGMYGAVALHVASALAGIIVFANGGPWLLFGALVLLFVLSFVWTAIAYNADRNERSEHLFTTPSAGVREFSDFVDD